MSQNNTHDQSSSTNSTLLPINLQNIAISNWRSSSRINSREVSSPQRHSTVRRGISKTNVTSNNRRSSKGTPQSRRKNKEIDIDLDLDFDIDINIESAMDYDVNNVYNSSSPKHAVDEQQNLLNLSSASADTTIAATLNQKKRLLKRPIEYFTRDNDGEKVKCSLCLHVSNIFLAFFCFRIFVSEYSTIYIAKKLAPLKEQ